MKYVALFVALLACNAAAPPKPLTSPAPLIVFVHGRGQLGQDTAAMRREWKRDVDSALASVGLPRAADGDVRLAWYADVLDPESESGCLRVKGDSAALGFGAFTRGLLGSLTSSLPERESRGARGIISDILYVVDPWKRCAAERRVGDAIESAVSSGRPVVIVAYSLGSVVAYDYLSSRSEEGDLHLITVGSPLGVPELRDLMLPDEPAISRPRNVASWVNVYDPDDFFSAPIARERSQSGILNRRVATASADNAHEAHHYLRDRATAQALAEALCSVSRARFGDACKTF